jgi:Na+/H+-dicarboxylate symporter
MKIKLNLTTQIIIGMLLGIILGATLGPKIAGIKIVGNIFLRLIQMAVIPLVLCTVVSAIGKLPIKQLGRLGIRIVLWFTITTVIAALAGLMLGWLFHPGMGLHLTLDTTLTKQLAKNKVASTDIIWFCIKQS